MSMGISKKAIFFTLISVSIVALAVLFLDISKRSSDASSDEILVAQLNNFFKELQQNYLERALNVASHHAILALLDLEEANGLIGEFDSRFSEIVISGEYTYNDEQFVVASMVGNSFRDMILELEAVAEPTYKVDFGVGVIESVGISQSEPWVLAVQANVSINLTGKFANFTTYKTNITTYLDVSGFKDPLYAAMFQGAYDNIIINTTTPPEDWNDASFNEHVRYGTYVHWETGNGPSFLMRFTNPEESSECCGIESVLDGGTLRSIGMSEEKSSVDYEYYRNIACPCTELLEITSVDAAYRPVYLTSGKAEKYQVTATSEACPQQAP